MRFMYTSPMENTSLMEDTPLMEDIPLMDLPCINTGALYTTCTQLHNYTYMYCTCTYLALKKTKEEHIWTLFDWYSE